MSSKARKRVNKAMRERSQRDPVITKQGDRLLRKLFGSSEMVNDCRWPQTRYEQDRAAR